MPRHDDAEPVHAASATARLLDDLQLHGYRPHADEPDLRPLPDPDRITGALTEATEALVAGLADTRLEPDLADLLWSFVNIFHRGLDRIGRELDTNEVEQRRCQREQDGSEVRSVELERLLAGGANLIERRDAYETMREIAADLYEAQTGSAWRPRAGSMVNRRTLTAAMIDSRDFLAAKRRADIEPLVPTGARIAFAGGTDCNDHAAIWAALDRVHAKHPDMVLLHGGAPRGAERIAALWADQRKIAQIVYKPDWHRHAKAAPFKRNDALLDAVPIGVVVFPGSGVTDNLADKAKRLGIPLMDFRGGG
jgi:hypothetical protein